MDEGLRSKFYRLITTKLNKMTKKETQEILMDFLVRKEGNTHEISERLINDYLNWDRRIVKFISSNPLVIKSLPAYDENSQKAIDEFPIYPNRQPPASWSEFMTQQRIAFKKCAEWMKSKII